MFEVSLIFDHGSGESGARQEQGGGTRQELQWRRRIIVDCYPKIVTSVFTWSVNNYYLSTELYFQVKLMSSYRIFIYKYIIICKIVHNMLQFFNNELLNFGVILQCNKWASTEYICLYFCEYISYLLLFKIISTALHTVQRVKWF